MGLFFRYYFQKKEIPVLSRQHFMIKWLFLLLGFLLILVFSHTVMIIQTYVLKDTLKFFTLNFLQILSGTGLVGLLISPFFFPGILYGLPRLPETITLPAPHEKKIKPLPEELTKIKPDFEVEYLLFIQTKTDACMKELKPFLQTDCNLAYLSKLTGIPVHHFAYYFREVKKQTFNDFRNEWRVNHAKDLIKQGKANELTLEAIGLLSGFSTRNTFFTSFKKFERVSPKVFLSQLTK